ncbi:MAG: BLUF domain-containing protein [Alphaproteobacteria bacterium]|nr:BLUF domain-containing protein [Alphaproteobacteria bacterium]MDP3084117.1 BLUF domain-containing protein [Rubrivivax sp.]
MSHLRGIAYVSTAQRRLNTAELEALLAGARRLNLDSGVTGVLLYSDGNFMQYFEGNADAMQVTWDRIRGSRGHSGIIELLDETVAERNFGDWQMGFAQPTRSVLLSMSTAAWERSAAQPTQGTASGLGVLKTFWRNAQR